MTDNPDPDPNDETQTWTPEPPSDDDDDYEDPNPRAIVEMPPRPRPVLAMDRRRANEREAATHVSEAIKLVGVPGLLGELLETLEREVPVAVSECPTCKHVVSPYYRRCPQCEGEKNRRLADHTAELVRELKAIAINGDPNPDRERQIIKQLREYDHPDVDGLVRWCSSARDRSQQAGARGATKTYRKESRW